MHCSLASDIQVAGKLGRIKSFGVKAKANFRNANLLHCILRSSPIWARNQLDTEKPGKGHFQPPLIQGYAKSNICRSRVLDVNV